MKRKAKFATGAVFLWALWACAAPPESQPMAPQEGGKAAGKQTLLFYTTSSTDSPHRAVLPILFAIKAKEQGHNAMIFLAGDAVLLMKESVAKDVKAVGQPGAAEVLEKAVELKIPIHV